jgi:SAM-dependent methyltransferase
MGKTLRPYVGDRVLEIGAGIGTLTNQFIPRELYLASDVNPHYLQYLQTYSFGKPYLHILNIDAAESAHFVGLEEKFDTVLMINVLERSVDEEAALRNARSALRPGGRVVVLVPQHPKFYGTLDKALHRRKRYTRSQLEHTLTESGFSVESMCDFARMLVPGWWLNGKLLKRKRFSRVQLKALDTVMPALSKIDRLWPWGGLSIIGVAVKD